MTPAERMADEKRRTNHRVRVGQSAVRTPVWANTLGQVRTALGLSMRDVADGVKLSLAAYHQIEHGSDPMLSTADRIAAFFGKTVDELWTGRLP